MAALPVFHFGRRDHVVSICCALRLHIENHGWTEELSRRDLINGELAGRKVRGSVQVRSVVFQHPKAAGEVAVFFDCRVGPGFKPFVITGPGRQLVIDRIAEIDDACLASRNAVEEGIGT